MARRTTILAALALGLGAVEPPVADPLPDLSGNEDAPLTLIVTGIAPGAGSLPTDLSVTATSGDLALVAAPAVAYDAAAGQAIVSLRPVANANGSTALFVRIADRNGAETVLSCHLLLRPLPDPPQVGFSAMTMPAGVLDMTITDWWSIVDPDRPDPATLRYHLRAPLTPAVGDLLLAGAPLAPGATWTQADIAAGHLSFRLHDLPSAYTPVYAACDIDDGSTTVTNVTYAIYVSGPASIAPSILLPATNVDWSEGDAPVAVAADASVVANTDCQALAVRNPAGRIGDRLLLATGAGAGELSVQDGELRLTGDPTITGTVSGGADGAPLIIASPSLNWVIGSERFAQVLLRAVRFVNVGRDPGQGGRPLAIALTGAAGDLAAGALTVRITAIDDPPVVATAGIGSPMGAQRSVHLAAIDPDSPVLRWTLVAPPDVADLALAEDGLCSIRPHWIGTATATVAVDDGVNPPQRRDIVVRVTGPDESRPQPLAEAPLSAMAGETWSCILPWDTPVQVEAGNDAPAGLTIQALAQDIALVTWAVPAATAPGPASFDLFATATATLACSRLPVTVIILPRPEAVR